MTEDRGVVIVGAGIAGLACAQRLLDAAVDFVVLEAADRIGGRLRTDRAVGQGAPYEIGAIMIHGNRVVTHAWLAELGLHARPLPLMRRARFLVNGHANRLPTLRNLFHRTIGLRAFYQGAISLPRKMKTYAGPDLSLAEFLDRERALPGARRIIELLYAHAAAADLEEVGVRGIGAEAAAASEEFGYHNFQLVEGYDELVARRSGSFRDRVRLRTRVTRIRYDDTGVRIEASAEGSPIGIRAHCAVLTLPLGVLKADAVDFEPPLPEDKRAAIRSIAFGDAMVVLMRLQGGNLLERLGDFGLLWGGKATTFHRPYVGVRGAPSVLSGFVVGREARRRIALSDTEAAEATRAELETLLPSGARTGRIESFAVGRWTSNPSVRGGYSFLPVGADLHHRRVLAAPVGGVLFFAGEATHTRGESATVHGAIETGYRAAEEALGCLRSSPAR